MKVVYLESVVISLQFGFLFDTWWLVLATVFSVFLEFLLDSDEGVSGLAGLQPWKGAPDPLQKLQKVIANT